jgi:hypothetical protein
MSKDPETTRYYLRATDPTNNEQVAFECLGLAAANAKAAELRMGRYKRCHPVFSEVVGGRRTYDLRQLRRTLGGN